MTFLAGREADGDPPPRSRGGGPSQRRGAGTPWQPRARPSPADPGCRLRCWVFAQSGVSGGRRKIFMTAGLGRECRAEEQPVVPPPQAYSQPEIPLLYTPQPKALRQVTPVRGCNLRIALSQPRSSAHRLLARFRAPLRPLIRPLLAEAPAAPAMAALRRLLWPPPRLPPPCSPHHPAPGPWGRPAGTAPGPPGRPFSCREEDEGAVAEAAWRRRRRWRELSFAAAAGGGLVGLVCYQLYGDPRADSTRAAGHWLPSESAAAEPEDPPGGGGLLPIPVAAAKETVRAWERLRALGRAGR